MDTPTTRRRRCFDDTWMAFWLYLVVGVGCYAYIIAELLAIWRR